MGVLVEVPIYVTPRQYQLLRVVIERGRTPLNEAATILGVRQEDLMRDLSELKSKNLILIEKIKQRYYSLTDTAVFYMQSGFPEEVAYRGISNCSYNREVENLLKCIEEKTKYPVEELRIGLQYLVRNKCIVIERGIVVTLNQDKCLKLLESIEYIKRELEKLNREENITTEFIDLLKRRRLIKPRVRTILVIGPTVNLTSSWNRGLIKEKQLITVVKPEYTIELDKYVIKEFDLSIEPPTPPISKKHPFMQFIDELREVMVSMGFEEVKGPHVEAELWNFDALYQAQDHPAREIHDTFFVKTELRAIAPLELLERTKRVHEIGWGYKWNPDRALRLVLRSQTTAVTARAIYERGGGEYRVFTIDRNFRPESLDAKHSMEFYQLDGVIVGKDVNFKHLLYFFKELAAALGVKEVWFKPGYFPFTEPSVEGYIKHPRLGWIEVFPGGMFRPEVMEILGAKGYKAAAWGIGVDRLAMTVLGIDDIRLLFTRDISLLSEMKYRGLEFFTKKPSGRDIVVVDVPS